MIDRIAVLGLLAGMAALWVWNWSLMRIVERHERQIMELRAWMKSPEETRCHACEDRTTCPAFDTGVLYPCPYFRKENRHGDKR